MAFGLKGSADILGVTAWGQFLAVEIKTGKAKQSDQQKKFQAMIEKMNGLYCVAHNVEEALCFLTSQDPRQKQIKQLQVM